MAPWPAAPAVAAVLLSSATCWPTTPSGSRPNLAPVPSGSIANSAGSTNITRMRPAASSAAPTATAMRFLTSTAGRPAVTSITCSLAGSMSHHPKEIAGELIADEQEPAGHHDTVEREGVMNKSASRAPPCQRDEDRRQRETLTNLHADVEADDVGDQSVLRKREILQLGGEAEAMEEPEHEHRDLRVRLKPEEPPEAIHVLERLVDDRETDDRIDQVRVRADAAEHAREQRDAVPQREEAHVGHDILQAIEEEDHADQEQQVVVSRDHVLGAQIQQRPDRAPLQPLQEDRVLPRHAVGVERRGQDGHQ